MVGSSSKKNSLFSYFFFFLFSSSILDFANLLARTNPVLVQNAENTGTTVENPEVNTVNHSVHSSLVLIVSPRRLVSEFERNC